MAIALIIGAVVFAFVHGLNTGASLLAASLNVRGMNMAGALGIMVAGVALAPFLFGIAVAKTLANELVPWSGAEGQRGMLVSVIVTIVIIFILSALRVPSSLTLALIASISGYGYSVLGEVEWAVVGKVLGTMFLAPVVGGLLAFGIAKALLPLLPRLSVRKYLERGHLAAFTLLSFAYGSNDSQKMLSVAMIAFGMTAGGAFDIWWIVLLSAALFGLGSRMGVRRMSRTISTGVMNANSLDMVITEVSSSVAMLASTSIGSPVGLAQTMSGALLGSGLSQGYGKIRWPEVGKILLAWIVTLPVTFVIAALIGMLIK